MAKARAFRLLLQTVDAGKIICTALSRLYGAKLNENGCAGRVTNSAGTVSYVLTTADGVAGAYQIELLGKSSELALKSPDWVERHRLYVALGFNANLESQIIVVDFEPMLRTTGQLFPERNDLFEHITLEHDSELLALQERIKSAIFASLQEAARTSNKAARQ